MKKTIQIILVITLTTGFITAQSRTKKFSLSGNASFTASSKLFLNPNSPNRAIRQEFFPLDDILSYSMEIRYNYSKDFIIGLSIEKLETTEIGNNLVVGSQRIPVSEGYKVYPIELTVYYVLPFSTDIFTLSMGGGVGYYIGEHLRNFNGVELDNVEREFEYGIHFNITSDYMITDYFSIRASSIFRDPTIEIKSKYNKSSFVYNNSQFPLNQNPFSSKININGITFTIGAAFHF